MSPTAHLPILLPLSVMDWSYDTKIANGLHQFSANNCLSIYCRRTLDIVSAQFKNKYFSLLSFFLFALASIASLLASLMRLVRYPPGFLRGVGRKKSQQSSFYFLPALLSPESRGHLFLGSKLGFLPGPVCGVREKTASDAVSHLALLLFLLFTVFAQIPLH